MSEARKILSEMDKLLDQLLSNAQELLAASAYAIEEDELIKLQTVQDNLLTQLIKKDDVLYNIISTQSSNRSFPLRARVDKKLEDFQELNAQFIQNITSAQGVIHFKSHVTKELHN